jgi:hypothetical protein
MGLRVEALKLSKQMEQDIFVRVGVGVGRKYLKRMNQFFCEYI